MVKKAVTGSLIQIDKADLMYIKVTFSKERILRECARNVVSHVQNLECISLLERILTALD